MSSDESTADVDGLDDEAPSPRTAELIRLAERRGAHNYAPLPVVIAGGKGCWVWDVDGKKFLDCISAYSSLNQGHCHPRIVAALVEQASRLTLTSRAVHNDQLGHFLDDLCELTGFEKTLPMNTGVEAVETAIKLARKWGYTRKGVERDQAQIIVCKNNFHGRTTTVVGLSTVEQYRADFGPYSAGFVTVDFGDSDALEAAINDSTVAFLVEPIQAESGIRVPPEGYLTQSRRICRRHNVLFMLDEIQTGLGRTGKMFAFEHDDDARPDVLIIGKALGGGAYPVSAVLAGSEVMSVFRPGDHGSTFGGNPLASAVARAALRVVLDERLAERARGLGVDLITRLRRLGSRHVADVRGRGLLVGIEIHASSGTAAEFAKRLMSLGVLCKDTHAQVLRLAPPLIIEQDEIDWLVERLETAFH